MINVELERTVGRWPVPAKEVTAFVNIAHRQEPKIRGKVEIIFVGERRMRTLNNHFRGRNKVTDVLSFAWHEDQAYGGDQLGQVYLCYPYIVRQARRFHVTPREEVLRMLVHGLLHLVGYDHVKEKDAARMFSKQEKILETAFRLN